jgi:NAD(P)-dependent dehydrogenase (short-subunit alcohol dehydrogenase family)
MPPMGKCPDTVIHGVRSFAPHLIGQGSGHLLNTASSGGLAALPDRTPYTGMMHTVVGLTETPDAELRRPARKVGATVLCPGLVAPPGPELADARCRRASTRR